MESLEMKMEKRKHAKQTNPTYFVQNLSCFAQFLSSIWSNFVFLTFLIDSASLKRSEKHFKPSCWSVFFTFTVNDTKHYDLPHKLWRVLDRKVPFVFLFPLWKCSSHFPRRVLSWKSCNVMITSCDFSTNISNNVTYTTDIPPSLIQYGCPPLSVPE